VALVSEIADAADHTEVDTAAPSDVARAQIHLGDLRVLGRHDPLDDGEHGQAKGAQRDRRAVEEGGKRR